MRDPVSTSLAAGLSQGGAPVSEIVELDVSLTLRSPFLFQGLANAMLGIDAAHLRDEQKRPIIPADQIRGVLRAACETLAGVAPAIAPKEPKDMISLLFGAKSLEHDKVKDNSYDVPNRGLLTTGDLAADLPATSDLQTTRIEIDDDTGAVAAGALQVIELVAPFGKEIEFAGKFHLFADKSIDAQKAIVLLQRALALIPAIGAFKSAGFGEVVRGAVTARAPRPMLPAAAARPPARMAFRVTFDRPILVDATRETDNLFIGSAVVPGAAFKGALAWRLTLAGIDTKSDGEWSTALEDMRVSHAFPENDDGEVTGFAVPASLYAWAEGDKSCFGDALLEGTDDGPVKIFRDVKGMLVHTAPTYPLDWKDKIFDKLPKAMGFPKRVFPEPQPRTHVRIGADTLVAVDGALFTTVAQGVRCNGETRSWRVVVDFSDVAPDKRAQLLALIMDNLGPIGRTGAMATFAPMSAGALAPDANTPTGRLRLDGAPDIAALAGRPGYHALTLVTHALLTDPQAVEAGVSVQAQYDKHIATCTGGTLERVYATRRLAGGYVAMRHRPYGKETYYPFVLTEPGSVFLVKGGSDEKLKEIARKGLPQIALRDAAPLTWQNCPYLRENGYGEVAFSLVDHAKLNAEPVRV